MSTKYLGRLLSANVSGFVVGCQAKESNTPNLGSLVHISLADDYQIYGLIYDIRIDDDGLVRQLVTLDKVDEQVIADNRQNRNVPLEFSVLSVGYCQNKQIFHLLPPRPPLSLDTIYLCDEGELRQFTSSGRFGYFRHVLRAKDIPIDEVLAAHIHHIVNAYKQDKKQLWKEKAIKELIILLRDDYSSLMSLLSAINDAFPEDSLN